MYSLHFLSGKLGALQHSVPDKAALCRHSRDWWLHEWVNSVKSDGDEESNRKHRKTNTNQLVCQLPFQERCLPPLEQWAGRWARTVCQQKFLQRDFTLLVIIDWVIKMKNYVLISVNTKLFSLFRLYIFIFVPPSLLWRNTADHKKV